MGVHPHEMLLYSFRFSFLLIYLGIFPHLIMPKLTLYCSICTKKVNIIRHFLSIVDKTNLKNTSKQSLAMRRIVDRYCGQRFEKKGTAHISAHSAKARIPIFFTQTSHFQYCCQLTYCLLCQIINIKFCSRQGDLFCRQRTKIIAAERRVFA